jgi:hypothetical protein
MVEKLAARGIIVSHGTVSLTCGEQNEPDAGCALTRLRPHLAIGSPPRRGISVASSGR